MQRNRLILLLYIMGLQVLDVITTYLAIQSGARELNPVVNLLLENAAFLIVLKIMVGLLVYKLMNKTLLVLYSTIMFQAIITNIINAIHLAKN